MPKTSFTLSGSEALVSVLDRAQKQAPDAVSKVIQNTAEKGKDTAKKRITAHGAVDTEFMRDHVVAKHPKPLESVIHSQASYSGLTLQAHNSKKLLFRKLVNIGGNLAL